MPPISIIVNRDDLESFQGLDLLHLLNVSGAGLLFQHVALGLDFPLAHLNNLVTESRCNLFQSLMPSFTVASVSVCCVLKTDNVQRKSIHASRMG